MTFVVLNLPFILGCELGSGLDDNALVGSWAATSVQQDGVELLGVTGISFALTMRSGGTFSESVTGDLDHVVCKGEGITSCTRDGTYEYTNDYLAFCDPECDGGNQYLVTGNTITYVLVASVNPFSDARPFAHGLSVPCRRSSQQQHNPALQAAQPVGWLRSWCAQTPGWHQNPRPRVCG